MSDEPWKIEDVSACEELIKRASEGELRDVERMVDARRSAILEKKQREDALARRALEDQLEAQRAQGPYDDTQRVSLHGSPSDGVTPGAPQPIDPKTGMHGDYYVLSEAERKKGFVRPVRRSYKHGRCGTVTTMALALAETYARDPKFYGATFCSRCCAHFPVGADGDFTWDGTDQKVGT